LDFCFEVNLGLQSQKPQDVEMITFRASTVGFNLQKWAFFASCAQKPGTIGEIWC
jgi:hypothetical protein